MSLAVETIETKQGAQLMASPEIQYVSLVQHAANREPFRVVKNDQTGGGNNMGGSVIQRIIAPVGTDLVAVLKEEGIDFAGNVSVEVKSEHEGYDIYTQMGVEKFDTSIPFQLKRMSDNAESTIMAVYGTLKDEKEASPVEAVKSELESPLSTTIVDINVEQSYYGMYVTTTSAMDSLDNELYNLMRGIYAIASAVGLDGKTRLKTMLALVDGFRNFINTLMAFVNDSTDSSTKSENQESDSSDILHLSKFEKLNAMISAVNDAVNKSEVIEMNPEEIAALVTKSVADALATATKSEADSAVAEITTKMEAIVAETEAIKKEKEDLVTKSESLSAEIEALKAEKAELEKKISDMEALPSETPAVKSEFSGFVTVTGAKKADGFAVFDSLFAGK